jgi:hypothetical protein
MITQTLKIIPHGLIESGQIVIQANEKTGLIDVSESIVVGFGPFNKTIQGSKVLTVDPSVLLSENIKEGEVMDVGSVKIKIEKNAKASIIYKNGEDILSGMADLDLSGKFVKIAHANLTGQVQGESVQLEISP